jgi:hypothetical protein
MGLATTAGTLVARAVGGDTTGFADTATATSATSITATGTPFTASSGGPPATGGLVGHVVVAAPPPRTSRTGWS